MRKQKGQRPTPILASIFQSEAERRALVRGALNSLKLNVRIARELEFLILFIDHCDDGTGCRAFADRLAKVPRREGDPPMAERTLRRRLKEAREHGLLSSWTDEHGRRRNRVVWEKVVTLARPAAEFIPTKNFGASNELEECTSTPVQSGRTPGQSGRTPGQSGRALNNDYSVPYSKLHSPPLAPQHALAPADTTTAVDGDAGGGGEFFSSGEKRAVEAISRGSTVTSGDAKLMRWPPAETRAIENELRGRGVDAADYAVRLAQERDLTAGYVRAVIAHFDANKPAWEAGGLYLRLKRGGPEDAPDDPRLWPPQRAEFTRAKRVEANATRSDERARERAKEREADARERQRETDNELRFGPMLDAMSAEQISCLASEAMGKGAELYKRDLACVPIPRGVARVLLMAKLAKREGS